MRNNIFEAALSSADKMKMFDAWLKAGRPSRYDTSIYRRENLKLIEKNGNMNKLIDYMMICKNHNFDAALAEVQKSINNLKASQTASTHQAAVGTQTTTQAQNNQTQAQVNAYEFDISAINLSENNFNKDNFKIINKMGAREDGGELYIKLWKCKISDYKPTPQMFAELLSLLIISIVCKANALSKGFSDIILNDCKTSKDDLKIFINKILSNNSIVDKLKQLLDEMPAVQSPHKLEEIAKSIKLSCPAYLGAPYPEYDEYKINEFAFAPCMRAKDFIARVNNAKYEIQIDWVTQGSFTRLIADKTFKEIKRCIIAICKLHQYMGPKFSVLAEFTSRDGQRYGHDIIQDYITIGDLTENLKEDIERHEELNPKIFNGNELKPEVVEKINQIVNEFLEDLQLDNINIDVKDIVLTGSNASYNYTKDSDIDIHIVADMTKYSNEEVKNLLPKIYDAYKKNWKSKYTIKFYDTPIELYVETYTGDEE